MVLERPQGQPASGLLVGLERKVLEELICERVRVTVDLCQLLEFERDLAASIDRALAACAGSPSERSTLALDYLERAWDRVTDEVLGSLAEQEVACSDVARSSCSGNLASRPA